MQIKLNLQIFIFILVFIITKQIEIYVILMLFALIHELGHIIVGILLGLKPKVLKIMPFGLTVIFEDSKLTEKNYRKIEKKKIIVALAGPFINLIIMVIALLLNKELIAYSNLLIMLFNLIPIYPLDGGRALKSIMRLKKEKREVDKLINKTSNILVIIMTAVSSVLIIYMKNFVVIFIVIYLWYIVIIENKRYKVKKRVEDIISNL
ncbi:MAG: hypothetical protein E7310_01050 [Clostridiales bacterium]|nr:hypothetical protein [Clostridiales bacterium]